MARFSSRFCTTVPDWLAGLFEGLDNDPSTRELVAATVAAGQCTSLAAYGVKEFHFYTLNRPHLTMAVCRLLGLKPRAEAPLAVATA
jgi:methylenetetrahydrofolate reductase (NADPH)